MDLKHEVAYRGVLPGAVKAEPGVSHNGHQANGHVRDWMAGGAGAGSPSPGPPVQPQPNGYSSPLSSGSYGPYSPNGKIGAQKLVEHLHRKGVPIALATSSSKDSVDMKMQNHQEFLSLFHHLTMGSTDPEVTKGKPDPAIFLVCASRFPDKPKPEDCLVFEDAVNGIKAANAANMQVVAVPDPRIEAEQLQTATLVLKSLEDFKPELFGLPAYDN